jgi:hypothetical protein
VHCEKLIIPCLGEATQYMKHGPGGIDCQASPAKKPGTCYQQFIGVRVGDPTQWKGTIGRLEHLLQKECE